MIRNELHRIKGMIDNFWLLIYMMIVVMAVLGYWDLVASKAGTSGPFSLQRLLGLSSIVMTKRKGIVLTTSLLATIIMIVVVAMVLFLLFGSVQAEAGSTSSGFFYGAFDAILRMLPWVK